jgi:hypothetical protein
VKADILMKAVDALFALRQAVKYFRPPRDDRPRSVEPPPLPSISTAQGQGGPLEARLASVVVAALKEAFDRDHARLELERSQIDDQRRRSEEALGLELRRQAADRELARLRLVAGAAMIGWIASVVMLGAGFVGESAAARVCIAGSWGLLLAALGAAFSGQQRIGASLPQDPPIAGGGPAGAASLWLLLAGLAVTAVSLLL